MADVKIIKPIAVIGLRRKFSIEANMASYEGMPPHFDIRLFDIDRTPRNGVWLFDDELETLRKVLNQIADDPSMIAVESQEQAEEGETTKMGSE